MGDKMKSLGIPEDENYWEDTLEKSFKVAERKEIVQKSLEKWGNSENGVITPDKTEFKNFAFAI